VRNTIVIDLHKRGCMVWNNDVDRILESDYMPQYHPFTSYLKSLPAWDGTDRVTPLAARVSRDPLWTTVFHRWLRAMVAGWHGAEGGTASQTGGNAMIPLLVSEEQGLRKSTFCRMLLPPELRNYYSEKNSRARSGSNWLCRALHLSTSTSLIVTASTMRQNSRIWCSSAPCSRAVRMRAVFPRCRAWLRLLVRATATTC
jgi:hypothetical protein